MNREAIRFAVAVTNQNAGRAADVKADSESGKDPCDMAKTGRHPVISINQSINLFVDTRT